ncbi:MAG TPA: hypothetical protein EYO73_08390 [Sulfurimonas sp.]|nr:hypothetical protein [Sulfurimonas sp.]
MILKILNNLKTLVLILFSLHLLTSSALADNSTDTCYSVQLASVYNKNSIYLKLENYPSSCKLISLANLKAVRCGCYDDKKEAHVALRASRKRYHGSILVRTYKSRFIEKLDIASEENKRLGLEDKKEDRGSEDESIQDSTTQDIISLLPVNLWIQDLTKEGEFSVQGHVNVIAQGYPQRPVGKHKANLTLSGELELKYSEDDTSIVSKIYAQGDSHDVKGSSQHNERTFLRLDELYIQHDFEDDQIMFGQSVRFWGALEVNNLTDVFNPTDYRTDLFDSSKLGVLNLAYTHYTDTGELSLIVKLSEPDRDMAAQPYLYYFFPVAVQPGDLPGSPIPTPVSLGYTDKLNKETGSRPSFFMKYSGSTDTEYAWDYSIIYENGYDSQRYYTYTLSDNNTSASIQENAYLVNKVMSYNTIVVGSTLVKIEAVYTDIIKTDPLPTVKTATGTVRTKKLSDYLHIGLGLEHTLTQVYNEADLGLIAEYYRYEALQSGDDYFTDLELFEIYQNDLFIGGRYSFNEGNDASILTGLLYDLDYDEQVYSFEYETRLAELFKLKFSYYYIRPTSDANTVTAYSLMGTHQRLSLNLGYYF